MSPLLPPRPQAPRFMEYIWAGIAAMLLVAYLMGCQGVELEARCSTDSDCMKHCPPPADDPDCDGGPQ